VPRPTKPVLDEPSPGLDTQPKPGCDTLKTNTSDTKAVVLDTNILLDVWLYQDPATPALQTALQQRLVNWVATPPMREEFHRVLTYPHITLRRSKQNIEVEWMLAQFDAYAQMKVVAPRAPYVCKDPDDQKFIDLAVAHKALLISKDKQVLRLTNRLARLSVYVKNKF
jgi:putative PIN family toxin of toxin-antitoxin system